MKFNDKRSHKEPQQAKMKQNKSKLIKERLRYRLWKRVDLIPGEAVSLMTPCGWSQLFSSTKMNISEID
jgi:hypothetical protein